MKRKNKCIFQSKVLSVLFNYLPRFLKDISRILKATENPEMVCEMGCCKRSSISTAWATTAPKKTACVAAKLTLNTRLENWK